MSLLLKKIKLSEKIILRINKKAISNKQVKEILRKYN